MQADVSGNWLYIYSGREFSTKNPDMTQIGEKDPFQVVHCIRLDQITGVKVDHVFDDQSITIFANGHIYPIRCTFGARNCHRINCHGMFLDKITDVLGLCRSRIWDLERRHKETALSETRADWLANQADYEDRASSLRNQEK